MPNMLICEGTMTPTVVGRAPLCDAGWEVVPYVEPTDASLIYAELVALNEFDPAITAMIVTGCLVLFITGFSAGMVLKRLRSA